MAEKEKLKKNDFIELRYIGITEGEIFDTNIKEEAKKIELEIKTRPLIICIGQNMILPAIDEFLIGKEIGKYTLSLRPEEAFGKRSKELVKIIPLSVFKKHNISPEKGMMFSFDGMLGKIVTGGSRILVDFNNPIAGKNVIYELEAVRIVKNTEEKVKALFSAFFKREFEFEIKEKKLIIKLKKDDEKFVRFIEIFEEKFKEILNLELETI